MASISIPRLFQNGAPSEKDVPSVSGFSELSGIDLISNRSGKDGKTCSWRMQNRNVPSDTVPTPGTILIIIADPNTSNADRATAIQHFNRIYLHPSPEILDVFDITENSHQHFIHLLFRILFRARLQDTFFYGSTPHNDRQLIVLGTDAISYAVQNLSAECRDRYLAAFQVPHYEHDVTFSRMIIKYHEAPPMREMSYAAFLEMYNQPDYVGRIFGPDSVASLCQASMRSLADGIDRFARKAAAYCESHSMAELFPPEFCFPILAAFPAFPGQQLVEVHDPGCEKRLISPFAFEVRAIVEEARRLATTRKRKATADRMKTKTTPAAKRTPTPVVVEPEAAAATDSDDESSSDDNEEEEETPRRPPIAVKRIRLPSVSSASSVCAKINNAVSLHIADLVKQHELEVEEARRAAAVEAEEARRAAAVEAEADAERRIEEARRAAAVEVEEVRRAETAAAERRIEEARRAAAVEAEADAEDAERRIEEARRAAAAEAEAAADRRIEEARRAETAAADRRIEEARRAAAAEAEAAAAEAAAAYDRRIAELEAAAKKTAAARTLPADLAALAKEFTEYLGKGREFLRLPAVSRRLLPLYEYLVANTDAGCSSVQQPVRIPLATPSVAIDGVTLYCVSQRTLLSLGTVDIDPVAYYAANLQLLKSLNHITIPLETGELIIYVVRPESPDAGVGAALSVDALDKYLGSNAVWRTSLNAIYAALQLLPAGPKDPTADCNYVSHFGSIKPVGADGLPEDLSAVAIHKWTADFPANNVCPFDHLAAAVDFLASIVNIDIRILSEKILGLLLSTCLPPRGIQPDISSLESAAATDIAKGDVRALWGTAGALTTYASLPAI